MSTREPDIDLNSVRVITVFAIRRSAKYVVFACIAFFCARPFAAEFELKGWPGEGIPVLIAKDDVLALYERPDTGSDRVMVDYRKGWRVPFDQSIHRTIRSQIIVVRQTKTIEISCPGSVAYTFKQGEEIEYLQYAAEGYGTARVGDRICQVPFEFEVETFGSENPQPETEWWVRMIYGDGSSPGWLFVMDGQVSFGRREF